MNIKENFPKKQSTHKFGEGNEILNQAFNKAFGIENTQEVKESKESCEKVAKNFIDLLTDKKESCIVRVVCNNGYVRIESKPGLVTVQVIRK